METLSLFRYEAFLKRLEIFFSNKYNTIFLLLLLLSFILRLSLRSNYLDDWDSVQFVMGLHDYSIPDHQPHPPGYPLYIFIGRIFNLFIGDDLLSFTLISAIFGTLALIPVYLLSKKIFDERVGLLSAVFLSFAPAQMLFSEVVMTDIVSLFFVTLTAYILYLGITETKYLYFGSLLLGIIAGLRMTDIIMVVLLFIVLTYIRDFKKFIISGFLVMIGIGTWLIPIIIDTGLDTLLFVQRSQWSYNSETSTLASLGGVSLYNLFLTFKILIDLLIDGWSLAVIIFMIAVFICVFTKFMQLISMNIQRYKLNLRIIFILSWLLIYLSFSIYNYFLYIPRYLLPLFPPMAIIFAYTIIELIDMQHNIWSRRSLSLIFFISIVFMGSHSITASYAIHTTSPAPVDAAYFIQDQYEPNEIIIGASESYRHLQYYLPQFDVRFLGPSLIKNALDANQTIISEVPITFYKPEIAYEFQRDHKIYPKHSFVKLYETIPKTLDNQIIINGWHALEDWDDTPTRWMENDATLMIYSDENRVVDLSFKALSFYRPRSIEIYVNDLLQMETQVPSDRFVLTRVPGISLKEGPNIVRLYVPDGCERPSNITELNNPDSRCLSLAVQDIKIARDILVNDLDSSYIYLDDGWHALEDWNGTPTRWMENDAIIVIEAEENRTVELSFQSMSFYRPRKLEILVNNISESCFEANAEDFVHAEINVSLDQRYNIINFHILDGCERPCDYTTLNNSDERCLSVACQNIYLSNYDAR